MIKTFRRLSYIPGRWIKTPIENAAERMALARIVYSVFFLFYLSYTDLRETGYMFGWLLPRPFGTLPRPNELLLPWVEPLLVLLLVLLLFGLWTRVVTGLVWLVGSYWVLVLQAAFGMDKLLVIMGVYVPLLACFSHWGALYSVDARYAKAIPERGVRHWVYFWPARSMLILLAFLYFSAGFYKLIYPGGWLQNPSFLSDFLQIKPIQSVISNGTPLNPLVTFIAQYEWLTRIGQYGILAFELTFPVVLVSGAAYLLYMRLLPFFHAANAFLFGIPFLPIMPAYILLFDWKNFLDATPIEIDRWRTFPLTWWQSVGIAGVVALGWNTTPIPRFLFGGFGLFESNRSFWYLMLPIILVWYGYNLWQWWRKRTTEGGTAGAVRAAPQAE